MAMQLDSQLAVTGYAAAGNGDDGVEVQPAFLATAAASPFQRRLALGVVILSTLGFIAAVPFAKVKLAEIDAFIPAYESALIMGDLVTAVLLFGQFAKLRSAAILCLAAGYLFDALIIVPHALSFPGVFGAAGVIGGGPQTTAWLYMFWHAGFPAFVIAYAVLKRRPRSQRLPAAYATSASLGVVILVGVAALMVTAGHDGLPAVMRGNRYSSTAIFFLGGAWLLSGLALLALWLAGIRSVLDLWMAVVMGAWTCDIALSAVLNGGRYDLGFYAGRGYGLLAAGFILVVLLLETSGLMNQLAETTAQLADETGRLKGHVRETEAQLRQAQKMEAIGNLTGGMAHDFNNLLAVIVGNLDLLVETRTGDREVQLLGQQALDAALRGADLIRRLLAFARRQPLQPRRVDLNELINDHTKLLRRLLDQNIDLELDLADGVWPTVIDPTQLASALNNLAANARDAMPRGGRLTIRTANRQLDDHYAAAHPEVAAGDYACIEVSDTGSGIPPEVVDRIFEPFFSTKGPGKGTGLGLSMVYGFMKQSEGHVNVYSEPGIGTTFRLYMPRAAGEQASGWQAPAAASEPRGSGEVVLAVDDVAALRGVVVRQLGELGYRVLEADSTAAALATLERHPVDILYTDVVLSGGATGFDLAAAAAARWPKLRVIFTSGFPDAKPGNGDGPKLNGRLLNKPVRKDELAQALREALDGRRDT